MRHPKRRRPLLPNSVTPPDHQTAINAYDAMWIYVLFDLPVDTKAKQKRATQFRNGLKKDGFAMFQFSVYIRPCPSRENAEVHIRRVQRMVPAEGMVSILLITDKQFGQMRIFYGAKASPPPPTPLQLELF